MLYILMYELISLNLYIIVIFKNKIELNILI